MVIDYMKLNEITLSDEFPLLKWWVEGANANANKGEPMRRVI